MKRNRYHTFNRGDKVIERIGDVDHVAEIIRVDDEAVMTDTGNVYDRFHGGRFDGPYRSIRHPVPKEAARVLEHCAEEMERA